MIDLSYVYRGLCGLARAHRANTMAGHLGAAVVAGYFFGEEHPRLDDKVHAAVEQDLDRIIRGEESLWFDPKKTGLTVAEMFAPFPDEEPGEEQISTIASALSANIDKTRQSGHNVIFAAIAIRALHDHPAFATSSIIEGIQKLIHGFDGAVPGRGYYGKQRGWIVGNKVTLPDDSDATPYRDQQAMAETVIGELIRWASLRRQGFGGLFHIINHAAALVELSLFGYRDLARRGLAAHYHHLQLWRSLPDVEAELGPLKKADHDPRSAEYWSNRTPSQWSASLTHRIKTLYGFSVLLRLIEQPTIRRQAEEKFLYLMA